MLLTVCRRFERKLICLMQNNLHAFETKPCLIPIRHLVQTNTSAKQKSTHWVRALTGRMKHSGPHQYKRTRSRYPAGRTKPNTIYQETISNKTVSSQIQTSTVSQRA